MEISFDDFLKVDVRVGTVVDAQSFPEARRPAIKLWVDLGAKIGVRKTSAQLNVHYTPDVLIGRQVAAVVNFSPKQVGKFIKQMHKSKLVTVRDQKGNITIMSVDRTAAPYEAFTVTGTSVAAATAAASAAEGGDAQPAKKARSDGKKDFDRKLVGTSFF